MFCLTCLLICRLIPQSLQLEFSETLNFINESASVATFEPWLAAKTGLLKFNFKTFDSDGLLFYAGDHNDPTRAGNYMYLKLEWGEAVLVTQVIDSMRFPIHLLTLSCLSSKAIAPWKLA